MSERQLCWEDKLRLHLISTKVQLDKPYWEYDKAQDRHPAVGWPIRTQLAHDERAKRRLRPALSSGGSAQMSYYCTDSVERRQLLAHSYTGHNLSRRGVAYCRIRLPAPHPLPCRALLPVSPRVQQSTTEPHGYSSRCLETGGG